MKSLIFVLLFVGIQSYTLKQSRIQERPTLKQTYAALNNIKNIPEVYNEISKKFNEVKYQFNADTIGKFFKFSKTVTEETEQFFTKKVYDYIIENLGVYCTIINNILKQISDVEPSRQDFNKLKLDGVINYYYAVTYLFNYGYDVDLMLHAIYFLQTMPYIGYSDQNKVKSEIETQLSGFIKNFKLIDNSSIPASFYDKKIKSNASTKELYDQLKTIKSNLSLLGNDFNKSIPTIIIDHDLVIDPTLGELKSVYVFFLIEIKSFNISYSQSSQGSIPSQQLVIEDWNCTNITHGNTESAELQETNTKTSRSITVRKLKDSLKVDSNYLNAVQYHNVVADVLISHAFKQWFTMITGLKTLFLRACQENAGSQPNFIPITYDLIFMMRTQFLLYQFYYDALITKILIKVPRILATHNINHASFIKMSKNFLTMLSILPNQDLKSYTSMVCDIIPESLKNLSDADSSEEILYKEYYFYLPTKYMFTTYHYYVTNMV